jgi:hypothetical protein
MHEANSMNQSTEPVYQIPESLFKGIVEYLSGRPFKEVGGAVPQLLAIKPVVQEVEVTED